ncbi:MAG: 3-methyl-2-oxobutanoate hydroxymethyltransferase [bacterium]
MKIKWTAEKIRGLKGQGKVVCLTAYDFTTARHLDAAGIHMALVGDSLANTVLGYPTTLPVTMDQMIHHTAAVSRGITSAMVVADMPFMSYQVSTELALANAGRFLKEAGADGVKVEGGAFRAEMISRLVQNGIPVLGHIGLTPQSIRQFGGYKVQGKKNEDAEQLIEDALALTEAGVFAIVIECVPAALGAAITQSVPVPTIGIGAGPHCDGQVLVSHDLLGLTCGPVPRFAKRYTDLGDQMVKAFQSYRQDVEKGTFPAQENCY